MQFVIINIRVGSRHVFNELDKYSPEQILADIFYDITARENLQSLHIVKVGGIFLQH